MPPRFIKSLCVATSWREDVVQERSDEVKIPFRDTTVDDLDSN